MLRRLILVVVLAALGCAVVASPAAAITNGTYDGYNHPYVGYATDTVEHCTGALLSPTVMVTAAHCFSGDSPGLRTNPVTEAPLVQVSFDPDVAGSDPAHLSWYVGSYYWDPQFMQGGGGVPGFDTHDVAVIIFTAEGCSTPTVPVGSSYQCGPIPAATTNAEYAALPSLGLVDALPMNSPVDVVGYGVQNFVNGGGPCETNCQKSRGDLATRFYAATTLVASDNSISDEFLKLHSNDGGACFGDSGGPDLQHGTNVIMGLNSFVANSVCTSNTYSYRVDTPEAQQWIQSTVAAYGASL